MEKRGERSEMKMQTKMACAVFLMIIAAIAFNALAVPVQAKNTLQVNMWGTYIGLMRCARFLQGCGRQSFGDDVLNLGSTLQFLG